MDTKFTEQESMEIITEMINRARNNVQKGAGTFMVFWGSMVALTALLNIALIYILHQMSIPVNYSFNIWWIMAPAWIVSFRLKSKRDKSAVVKSHIDNIIHSVWTAFGISNVIFLLILFGLAYSLRMYDLFYLVNPVIMLIVGIGGYITAKVCRFRPFMHGAIAMWTGSLVSALAVILTGNGNGVLVQFIILSVCMIIGFVIPGHKLNKLAKESHV